ncbi:MAG: enoyl-CoA hydratase/isomerase family protein [Planctomycetes bacterium]|nr:enoyl-CoA hydratase/isomerase family protein [Planctomycetota bacterium]
MHMEYSGKPAESFGFKLIRYEKRDHRAIVTFNRPAVHNAVNGPMLLELNAAFADAAWDDEVRVLILTGAGNKAFCTGADEGTGGGICRAAEQVLEVDGAFC